MTAATEESRQQQNDEVLETSQEQCEQSKEMVKALLNTTDKVTTRRQDSDSGNDSCSSEESESESESEEEDDYNFYGNKNKGYILDLEQKQKHIDEMLRTDIELITAMRMCKIKKR